MTTENNIDITMIDVDVVRSAPASPPATPLDRELWIAAVARVRQANVTRIEREAVEPKKVQSLKNRKSNGGYYQREINSVL